MSSAIPGAGNVHPGHGATPSTTALSSSRTEQFDPLLCPSKSGANHGGDAMENSALDKERCPHVRNETPPRLGNLDAHCRSLESTLPATISGSPGTSGDCISSQARQPPSLGDLLRGAILGAKLHNDSCWCWANAGLLCTLWAILCRQTFSLSDFGVQLRPVRAFLHALHSTPGLKVVEAFMDLFQHVQRTCIPRDVGEFVSELIVWLETEAISMT